MVKAYLRYEHCSTFGVIASGASPPVYDASGKHVLTSALENVSVWSIKQGSLVSKGDGAPPATTQDRGERRSRRHGCAAGHATASLERCL